MMSANIRIRFGLQIVLVCLYSTLYHYRHCANLFEGIEFMKCLSDIFVECASKIKHIVSVIHYTTCGPVCFQFTHSSCDEWENIYILCLIIMVKSGVWTITHCLGLDHETMVSTVCFSIYLQGNTANTCQFALNSLIYINLPNDYGHIACLVMYFLWMWS